MSTIRHICAGHEYRYDTVTRIVYNNWGSAVATLTLTKMTGYAHLDRGDNPKIEIASLAGADLLTDAELAVFAIGATAVAIPER